LPNLDGSPSRDAMNTKHQDLGASKPEQRHGNPDQKADPADRREAHHREEGDGGQCPQIVRSI
jgi:hypothetical protein